MAILKFLCQAEDFDIADATLSTNATYVDTTRVEYGFAFNIDEGLQASWPAPAGNTIWFHWRHGQSTTTGLWDDFAIPGWFDANGNRVFYMSITNGIVQFNLEGDSNVSSSFGATTGARMFDVQLTVNGTTDLTLNVYVDGVLTINGLTTGNVVNKGIPSYFWTRHTDGGSQGTQYWSEGLVADESTVGWRLRQHRPTAYATHNEWTDTDIVAAGNVGNNVGIVTNTNDDRVSFDLSNLTDIPSLATINRVCVVSRVQRGSTGLANFNHFFIYSAGPTTSHDSNVAVGTTLQEFISEYPTSPNTGVAWTDTEMQGLEVGVRGRT